MGTVSPKINKLLKAKGDYIKKKLLAAIFPKSHIQSGDMHTY